MCLPHHRGSPVNLRLVLLLTLVEHVDPVAALQEPKVGRLDDQLHHWKLTGDLDD